MEVILIQTTTVLVSFAELGINSSVSHMLSTLPLGYIPKYITILNSIIFFLLLRQGLMQLASNSPCSQGYSGNPSLSASASWMLGLQQE